MKALSRYYLQFVPCCLCINQRCCLQLCKHCWDVTHWLALWSAAHSEILLDALDPLIDWRKSSTRVYMWRDVCACLERFL